MEKSLKIAMLGHKRVPSREGGVEIVVGELAARMAAAGHKVTCYNRSGHHISGRQFDLSAPSEYKNVKLKTVPAVNIKGLAAMTSSVFAALRASFGKFDVVHFHAEGPCAMLWLPKLFGKTCIATVHGLDWQRDKWGGFASKYIKLGEKTAVKYADEIIVLSQNVKEYFKNTYNRETVFIPNGVSRPEIRPAERITEKYGIKKDDYILFLGRLVPEKGLVDLIKAFALVKTDKKLVIAGSSSDTDEFLSQLYELKKNDERIIFTGFVSGRELEELYSNAYIYTLPSRLEGMPLSLLEAMSYGLCCVVSDIAECAEVVEDKALTFKASDIEGLREKLQFVCDNPNKVREYSAAAADFICEKYNWDDVTRQTLGLYQKRIKR